MYAAGRLMPPPQILDEFYGGRPATVNTSQRYGRNLRRVRGLPPGTVPLPGTAGGLLPVRRQPSLSAKRRLVQRLVMSGAGWPHGGTAEPAYVRRVEVIGELPSYEEAPMQLRALQVGRPAGRVDGFLTSGIGETPHHVTRRRRWVAGDEALGDDDGLGRIRLRKLGRVFRKIERAARPLVKAGAGAAASYYSGGAIAPTTFLTPRAPSALLPPPAAEAEPVAPIATTAPLPPAAPVMAQPRMAPPASAAVPAGVPWLPLALGGAVLLMLMGRR